MSGLGGCNCYSELRGIKQVKNVKGPGGRPGAASTGTGRKKAGSNDSGGTRTKPEPKKAGGLGSRAERTKPGAVPKKAQKRNQNKDRDGDPAVPSTWTGETEVGELLKRLKSRPRDTVREEVPAILAAMVQRAKSGSHQDVKLLFELADIRAFLGEENGSASEKKLVDLLFERLGLGDEAKRVRRAAHV